MALTATVQSPAVYSFSEFTALQYLQIDIAGAFGLDREDWDVRIQWTLDHQDQFEAIEDEGGTHPLVMKADAPAMFYAAVCAYLEAQAGKPIGHMISLDATASVIQILAAMTGCRDSAELCNLINVGQRVDSYTSLYEVMKAVNGGDLAAPDSGSNVVSLKRTIPRSAFKQAIMTSLYNSTRMPKIVFGKGAMLDTFYSVMRSCLPGAWSCNEALKGCWQAGALSHDWTLPDNFHVHVKVMTKRQRFIHIDGIPMGVDVVENTGTDEGRSLSPNSVHSVDGMIDRELKARCDQDPEKLRSVMDALKSWACSSNTADDKMVLTLWNHYLDSGFLSVRILNFINKDNAGMVDGEVILKLIGTLPKKPFNVISVHDCFRCHPNYGNDMRRQYNQVMSDLARSDMLSFLVSQITGTPTPVTKLGCIADDILQADYALS
jgi:hypothetical protein